MSVNLELSPAEQRSATIKLLLRRYRAKLWIALVTELSAFALIYWATRSFKMVTALFVFTAARNMNSSIDILKFELKQHEASRDAHSAWEQEVAQRREELKKGQGTNP